MPVRYILSSVWVRLSIFSQLSIVHFMGLCFQFTHFPLWWLRKYTHCLIIIIKSEVWTIIHCLGLGHETMVCGMVCVSIFLLKNPVKKHLWTFSDFQGNYIPQYAAVLHEFLSMPKADASNRKYKDNVYRKMLVQEYLKKWRIFRRVKPKNDMMYHDIYNCICQNTKK